MGGYVVLWAGVPATFSDLLRSLPGVYPTEALRALERIGDDLPVGWVGSDMVPNRTAKDRWPVEHPLDFDWRFTPATARLLLDRCTVSAPEKIALLGAPSLVGQASDRRWLNRISIFDRNVSLVAAIKSTFPEVEANVTDLVWGSPVPVTNAAVAIADPPWYLEYAEAFLWAAARMTRTGGRVFLSFPGEGTRPGIPEEWRTLLSRATAFGLRLSWISRGALVYRTPPFERNSLLAAGVTQVPSDWRRGDLAEFIVVAKVGATRPSPATPPEEWGEVSHGSVRIKVRLGADGSFRDPALVQATSGDMLESVSRREPARAKADIWTSGNRIFRCSGPAIFRLIVSAMERGDDVEKGIQSFVGRPLSIEESNKVGQAVRQVSELVELEEREIADHDHRRNERDLVKAL